MTDETIYDSLGRVRETQDETADGNRTVTDTTYNSDGWKLLVSGPYYITGAPSGTLVAAPRCRCRRRPGTCYDGDGRVMQQITYELGTETWETDTTYGGNYTTVSYATSPRDGGTAADHVHRRPGPDHRDLAVPRRRHPDAYRPARRL